MAHKRGRPMMPHHLCCWGRLMMPYHLCCWGRTHDDLPLSRTEAEPTPVYDGHHVAIMLVGENKDVFQLACKNREHAGRFGLDQFSDKARNLNGTKIWKHFGWKDLCLTSKIKFLWSTRHGQERHRIFFFLNSETHCIYA
jgi:hypothetical protein